MDIFRGLSTVNVKSALIDCLTDPPAFAPLSISASSNPLASDLTTTAFPTSPTVGLGNPVTAAAAAADAAAEVAELAALVALPAADVAEAAALVADVVASPALVVAVVADEAALAAEVADSLALVVAVVADAAADVADDTAAVLASLMPGITPELSSVVIVLIWFIDVRTVASSVA